MYILAKFEELSDAAQPTPQMMPVTTFYIQFCDLTIVIGIIEQRPRTRHADIQILRWICIRPTEHIWGKVAETSRRVRWTRSDRTPGTYGGGRGIFACCYNLCQLASSWQLLTTV